MPITLDQCGDGFVTYLESLMPKKYVSKRITIEALQNTPETRDELVKWIGPSFVERSWDPVSVAINNEHGHVVCEKGDWIIKGTRGEFYPIKNETFVEKYEPVASIK